MVPLAALLLEQGHRVTGSDLAALPSHVHHPANAWASRSPQGFSPPSTSRRTATSSSSATRPSATTSRRPRRRGAGLPVLSLPQAVRAVPAAGQDLRRHHGDARQDDDLGADGVAPARLRARSGLPRRRRDAEPRPRATGAGAGPHFVLEGDEYNAAFFDRGPEVPALRAAAPLRRQHRVRPRGPLPGPRRRSIEAFRKVVRARAEDGVVVVNADDPRVVEVAREARAPVVRVSLEDPGADFSARDIVFGPEGTRVHAARGGPADGAALARRCSGRHNVRNALGAIALVARRSASRPPRSPARCRASRACGGGWRSRARRTASSSSTTSRTIRPPCAGTLAGGARALSGPPPLGALRAALEHRRAARCSRTSTPTPSPRADALVLAPVFHAQRLGPGQPASTARRSSRRFAAAGKPAFAPDAIDEIPEILRREARPGDVLLLMSSGAFGGLPETLLENL